VIDLRVTPTQLARAEREWTRYAGGLPVLVEATIIGEPIFGYGQELAIRRLAHRMGCGHFGYSVNLDTWYYSNKNAEPEGSSLFATPDLLLNELRDQALERAESLRAAGADSKVSRVWEEVAAHLGAAAGAPWAADASNAET
jgi:hypothetical protein